MGAGKFAVFWAQVVLNDGVGGWKFGTMCVLQSQTECAFSFLDSSTRWGVRTEQSEVILAKRGSSRITARRLLNSLRHHPFHYASLHLPVGAYCLVLFMPEGWSSKPPRELWRGLVSPSVRHKLHYVTCPLHMNLLLCWTITLCSPPSFLAWSHTLEVGNLEQKYP